MDFVSETLISRRRFCILTILDLYSRECLGLAANFSLRADDVVAILNQLKLRGRMPRSITADNGSEFVSKQLDGWVFSCGVKLDFIRPRKPVENAYIGSFNGRLRDECLNTNVFFTMAEVRRELEQWKHDYNTVRPHRALGGLPPRAMQTAGAVENQKTGFPQLLESSIHRSHSPDDDDLSIEGRGHNTAAQAVIQPNPGGTERTDFPQSGLVLKRGDPHSSLISHHQLMRS